MTNFNVSPTTQNPEFHIVLSDGKEKWGLILEDGARGLQEHPLTPSNVAFQPAGKKFGDWEPEISHIEQRSAHGGMLQDDFSLDKTRYFDGQNIFTLIEGHIHNGLQWKLSTGYRDQDFVLPGSVAWKALTGSSRYISVSLSASASYSADGCYIWLRRIGTPKGAVTLRLHSNSAGDPGTELKSATIAVNSIADVISVFPFFDWATTYSIVSGTTYHLVAIGDSGDDSENHWEVGVMSTGTSSKISSAGSSWTAANFTMYYRMVDSMSDKQWFYFIFDGSLFKVSKPSAVANSTLLVNGDRGKATSATATTLVQSTKSWTADQWISAWVKIIRGTGAGQTMTAKSAASRYFLSIPNTSAA